MTVISEALESAPVGEPVVFENLAMFPLLGANGSETPYLTLDAALAARGLSITEVSQGGSVPDLLVTNTLDRPVLLLDGEEVVGAKQNRVFNLTILVAAKAKTAVPVSCVEAGRWSHVSPQFASSPRTQHAAGRAQRVEQVSGSILARQTRHSDQSEVWAEIARKGRSMDVDSPTGAMADIYERHSAGVNQFVAALGAVEGQKGAIFAINSDVVGMDLFDAAAPLRALLPKLVRSYALDAIELARGKDSEVKSPAKEAVAAFLGDVATAPVESFAAVGLGEDLRLTGEAVAGAGLAVDGKVVHLCAFRTGARGDTGAGGSRMARSWLRRGFARRDR